MTLLLVHTLLSLLSAHWMVVKAYSSKISARRKELVDKMQIYLLALTNGNVDAAEMWFGVVLFFVNFLLFIYIVRFISIITAFFMLLFVPGDKKEE